MAAGRMTPVLRIFDEAKAKEFYVDFLGFNLVFEHRFEEGLPLYMGLEGLGCNLHLTEHHGDASPGAALRISVDDVEAYCKALNDKNYGYARPEIGAITDWGTREMTIPDPFGNRLTFAEAVET